MKPIQILVAEDDPKILTGLVDMLESEGYRAAPAIDGEQALKLFESKKFDLVLLDIMMPSKSGYDVCRAIRSQDERVPIIMLTAKGQEIDKVVGLQLGADDYVTKPFGVNELLARIAAVLRRSRQNAKQASEEANAPDHFDFGGAEIDGLQYRVRRGEQTFDLSGRELQLLEFFYAHPNEVLNRDRLLNAVWGIDYFGTTRTVDQHIAQLRKKIEPDPNNPSVITTVHGVGYRYERSQESD
ncbi:MAG: response regulator transcription factor [Deltaproteobacteria bacterium]|nr:response regulator transcription factor [Deltaproteobacteria bacterium]MBW1908621.1 response regulator transcription factor [Deltaproteobacteria bacterium]MBW2032362.1 response regulator transcription factor [Deltaproteobacteria bacterium]